MALPNWQPRSVLGAWARTILVFLGLLSCLSTHAYQSTPTVPHRTVVVLHSVSPETPGIQDLNSSIFTVLRKGSPIPVDVYSEYTGLDRFNEPDYVSGLLNLYNRKYKGRKVDLLITVGLDALNFAVSQKFLDQVPIVTCYIGGSRVVNARAERPEITGALPALNTPKTLELMLSMYPKTKRIEVVLGGSPYERNQAKIGRELFKHFESRVALDFTNDLSLEQLESRVSALSDDTLVLYVSLLQDATGRDFSSDDPLVDPLLRISKVSRRPVFGLVQEEIGFGIVGGVLLSMKDSGKAAAELGLRVLNGEPASSIPPVKDVGEVPVWDDRELIRWGIKDGDLPPGSRIEFRTPSLWSLYWKGISVALAILLVESLLIAALVIQLQRRKQVEKALSEAEIRYRTVADFAHDWEFWTRPDGTLEYVSPAAERVSGYTPREFKDDPGLLERLIQAEDIPHWKENQAEALKGRKQGELVYGLRTRSGELKWMEQFNNPVWLDDHRFAGSRGSIRDITARKQSELDIRNAYEEIRLLKDQLEAENTYYREKIQDVQGSSEILGQSDTMKYLHFRINQVALSDTTVLIQGATGTGKELVAEAIHKQGPRKDRPLVKINCAALPQGLAESELFGHEKGAFTGAHSRRKGRFELANGATLFMDEVGELSPEVQAKLLRVLQDGEFHRVGGDQTIKVDVRLITATNRNLAEEVQAGRFREDLWYRLNVFLITMPTLAQRKEDIPALAQAFTQRFCQRLGKPELELSNALIQSLQAYHWPGNVRELQNVIEQAVLISDGSQLRLAGPFLSLPAARPVAQERKTLEELERQHILDALETSKWKVSGAKGAAEILGLKPTTLRSRMLKLNIFKP
jgi:PAS domain S-box-containing protein